MYSINLIHEKIIPISQQRTRLSLVSFYVLLWLITGLVVAAYIITSQADIDSYTTAVRRLEIRNNLPTDLTREDVISLARQLQASQVVLTNAQNRDLVWAPKLERLGSFLPKDAWLNRLSCRRSTSVFTKPPSGGGRLQAPEPLGEFVIEGMVLISGDTAGSESLEQYVTRLQKDEVFMEKISSLNHLVIGRERFGTHEVATFVIVCVIEESVKLDV